LDFEEVVEEVEQDKFSDRIEGIEGMWTSTVFAGTVIFFKVFGSVFLWVGCTRVGRVFMCFVFLSDKQKT